jgi:hypothetical protein
MSPRADRSAESVAKVAGVLVDLGQEASNFLRHLGADHGLQRRDDWRGSLLDQVPVFDAIAEFADGVLADG